MAHHNPYEWKSVDGDKSALPLGISTSFNDDIMMTLRQDSVLASDGRFVIQQAASCCKLYVTRVLSVVVVDFKQKLKYDS